MIGKLSDNLTEGLKQHQDSGPLPKAFKLTVHLGGVPGVPIVPGTLGAPPTLQMTLLNQETLQSAIRLELRHAADRWSFVHRYPMPGDAGLHPMSKESFSEMEEWLEYEWWVVVRQRHVHSVAWNSTSHGRIRLKQY